MEDRLTTLCRFAANNAHSILYLIVLIDLLLSSVLYFNCNLFEFSDPLKGFEARGSSLANRINSWKLITGKHHSIDHLTLYPSIGAKKVTYNTPLTHPDIDVEEEEEKKRLAAAQTNQSHIKRTRVSSSVTGFCGDLTDSYVQFIVEPQEIDSYTSDLFTLEYVQAVCSLDAKIRSFDYFSSNCVYRENETDCCQSWTLPNLILKASNKTHCNELTTTHIDVVKELIDTCFRDYSSGKLTQECASNPRTCPGVPEKCYANGDLVFNLLNFILDANFVVKQKPFSTQLKHANMFIPLAKSTELMPFFHEIETLLNSMDDSLVKIGAYDLGLKDVLFEKLLVEDTKLLGLAFISVNLIFLLYTSSLLATFITSLNLLATLGGSLFIYRFIFGIKFFPFMNLMSVIILIAVGGDSVFIFYRSWQLELMDNPQRPLEHLLRSLVQRTFLSTCLTCITTSFALLATSVSQITSLKCFSVYSAIAVVLMYLLTLFSLPIVICYRVGHIPEYRHWISMFLESSKGSPSSSSSHLTPPKIISTTFASVFKYILIALMLAFTTVSLVLFLHGFHLPTSEYFSTLDEKHPFEKFDTKYRDLFKFSQRQLDTSISYKMPITLVFGIEPTDQGFYFDPHERGTLKFDHQFDLSNPQSQEWLLQFCYKLRTSYFYQGTNGPLLSNCFVETFKNLIEGRRCYDEIAEVDNRPCCNESTFPFDRDTFSRCVVHAMDLLHRTPTYIINRDGPGVLFWSDNGTVAALVVQYLSKFTISSSYANMKENITSVQNWLDSVAADAPDGLNSVWFITDHLELFAIQDSLINGTYVSVLLALILAFVSVILATRNIQLTIFATLTTLAIIVSTLSTLIYWFNWEINVVESVVFSIAIGISVDLPLHLIIGYQKNQVVGGPCSLLKLL